MVSGQHVRFHNKHSSTNHRQNSVPCHVLEREGKGQNVSRKLADFSKSRSLWEIIFLSEQWVGGLCVGIWVHLWVRSVGSVGGASRKVMFMLTCRNSGIQDKQRLKHKALLNVCYYVATPDKFLKVHMTCLLDTRARYRFGRDTAS